MNQFPQKLQLNHLLFILPMLLVFLLGSAMTAQAKPQPGQSQAKADAKVWPDVLVIDDFDHGLAKWDNQGTGSLTIIPGQKPGSHAMFWTADDDGMGHIVYKNLDRKKVDFSQYDYMLFHMKVEGKKLWNLNPMIQQSPVAQGYQAMYYSVDTLDPFNQWFTYVQNLKRWENAWPRSYAPKKQTFELEVYQLAGPGHTKLTIDRIWLVKSPVKVLPSYVGKWSALPDGSQRMSFDVTLTNRSDKPILVTASVANASDVTGWKIRLPDKPFKLAAGATGQLPVVATVGADQISKHRPYWGKVLKLGLAVTGHPQVVLTTDLAMGTQPAKGTAHPTLLCDADHAAALRKQYADPVQRKKMSRRLLAMVRQAKKLMDYQPEYPPLAAKGVSKDPITNGKLVKVDVPNLPFNVYQDPISGRAYSGEMFDAGVLNWAGIHRRNSNVAQGLAMGYLITGDKAMAAKAAAILKKYITVYPKLPIVAPAQTSPVGFAASGAVRIGSTYMVERVWLTSMAIALDSIRGAGVLSQQDIDDIRSKVFEPSAGNMMDHKVGAMNLQWQIQSAALFAGLASDSPSTIARSVDDSHGILNLTATGFLPSGQWWENPSYQNVTKLAAFPALLVAVSEGIMPWNKRMDAILKAAYELHAPDGRSPTLGTGGWTHYVTTNNGIIAFSQWLDDPQLAWVATHKQPRGRSEIASFAAFRQTTPPVDPKDMTSPVPTTTTLLSDYGGIAMRLPGTDQYCYFQFGRELVHGHRNKLSINAYGQGRWYVRNIMGGYQNNFYNFLETIASANTIIIDKHNADTDTGELLFHKDLPGASLASAREIGAWKHVEHERSLALIPEGLIILDRVKSDDPKTPHTADWLYHTNMTGLAPAFEKQVTPDTKPLAKTDNTLYESLKHVGDLKQFAMLNWQRAKPVGGLVQAFLPLGTMNLLQIDDANRPSRSLLWRQEGSLLRFGSVMVPYKDSARPTVSIKALDVHDAQGQVVGLDQAQAVRVKVDKKTITLLVNYVGKPMTAGGLTSSDRMAIKTADH